MPAKIESVVKNNIIYCLEKYLGVEKKVRLVLNIPSYSKERNETFDFLTNAWEFQPWMSHRSISRVGI